MYQIESNLSAFRKCILIYFNLLIFLIEKSKILINILIWFYDLKISLKNSNKMNVNPLVFAIVE